MPRWFVVPFAAALALGSLAAVPSTAAPASKAGFDGVWSVLIITESGECDRAFRYALRIANGTVTYGGDAGGPAIDVSGRVDPRGHVSVTLGSGPQMASGTGRLKSDRGAGTWKGRSSAAQCSGRWEAEKRGL